MTDTQLADAITEHEEYLFYWLEGAASAEQNGAPQAAASNVDQAAKHAAILTALKAIRTERAQP
jgi:hypothetical protein